MYAIFTKYLGPTNFRGGRIVAKCGNGRTIVQWNHEIGIQENHDAAAWAAAAKFLDDDVVFKTLHREDGPVQVWQYGGEGGAWTLESANQGPGTAGYVYVMVKA